MHMIKELIGDSRMTREQSNLMNARTALPSQEKFIVFEHEGLKADLLDFQIQKKFDENSMSFVCTQNQQRCFETINEIDQDLSRTYQK